MKKSISQSANSVLEKDVKDSAGINKFSEANERYKKLLKEGLTTKRGYNIKTLEEIYQPQGDTFSFQKRHFPE